MEAELAAMEAKLVKARPAQEGHDARADHGQDQIDMTRQDKPLPLLYGIELHQHRLLPGQQAELHRSKIAGFSVEQGRAILEKCGFTANFSRPRAVARAGRLR